MNVKFDRFVNFVRKLVKFTPGKINAEFETTDEHRADNRNQNGSHRRNAENAEVVAGSARFRRAFNVRHWPGSVRSGSICVNLCSSVVPLGGMRSLAISTRWPPSSENGQILLYGGRRFGVQPSGCTGAGRAKA